jgi:hypothetical protein
MNYIFQRLQTEVSIINMLNNSNVAEFLGTLYYHGLHPAMVMVWYPHGDASTYLENRPTEERLSLVFQQQSSENGLSDCEVDQRCN